MNQEILNSAAISEGAWVKVDALVAPITATVHGFATGDVAEIWVSNKYAIPASPAVEPVAGDGTFQYGGDISSDTAVEITGNFRWLRVRKSAAAGSPATTVAEVQGRAR